jgi:FG-GAP-like repeat
MRLFLIHFSGAGRPECEPVPGEVRLGAMRRTVGLALGLAAVGLVLGSVFLRAPLGASPAGGPSPVPLPSADDAAVGAQVQQQCSKCHVFPPPEYVPRGMWRTRVQEMAERSMTGTGVAPGEESILWELDLDKIARWFEVRSPEVLPLPSPWPEGDGGRRFVKHAYGPPGAAPMPIISNVRFYDLDGDGALEIVACDMGRGAVLIGDPKRDPGALKQVAVLANPAHAQRIDLDQDGRPDLLVADLGEFLPGDHEKGSVVWLRQTAPLQFEKHVLLDRLPRNADAEAADFDGDGDLDLVVASFGYRKVGGTFYYENQTTDWKQPRFVATTVDARPGAIHVPPVDLDRDGRLDFISVLAQQYEQVVAYVNRGKGQGFRAETIFRAPTPVWGSSGIQPIDLDQDGDLDVLMTNGDTLDDFTIRPFHGVRWLENKGGFPFVPHDLGAMPGVHRAQAADLDGDGDLDVVACAFLPARKHDRFEDLARQGNLADLTSVGWMEQVQPGEFRLHPLERGRLTHVTLDLGDFDGDGDVDLLVGNFVGFTFGKADTGFKSDTWVELWENQAKSPLLKRDTKS